MPALFEDMAGDLYFSLTPWMPRRPVLAAMGGEDVVAASVADDALNIVMRLRTRKIGSMKVYSAEILHFLVSARPT